MRLPKTLAAYARQAAATVHLIEPRTQRTEILQAVVSTAWFHGIRSGLMAGLPGGAILTLIIMWVFLWR